MNFMDRKLRKLAQAEPLKMPDTTKKHIEDVLDDLPNQAPVRFVPRTVPVLRAAACLAILFLVLLPNLSSAYASAMSQIPVIGKIIQVVTIRNYFDTQGASDIAIEVPEVQNQIADAINKDADELAQILIGEFYQELDISSSKGHISIQMDYEKIMDSPDWFTLKLDVTKIQASSSHMVKYYHIDKKRGQIMQLSDLFQDEEYQTLLMEEIHRQMAAQMAENPNIVYWDGSRPNLQNTVTVAADQNFYWSPQGNLILVFDKYAVGPGAMGCPAFEISQEVFRDSLKPEYQIFSPCRKQ